MKDNIIFEYFKHERISIKPNEEAKLLFIYPNTISDSELTERDIDKSFKQLDNTQFSKISLNIKRLF